MTFLFDVSPTEPQHKKPRKRQVAIDAECEKPAFVPTPKKSGIPRSLGRIDHTYRCIDETCQATCSDIWNEADGYWHIECCFCGTGQQVPALVEDVEQEKQEDVFRLPAGGREEFVGMTFDEVSAAGGDYYIEWAAGRCKDMAVREAAKTWLASRPVNP